jgi:predicted ATP-binding protein involved in virulence
MRIEQLIIDDLRCIEHVDISLDPHLNVFFGVNGAGKSSILLGAGFVLGNLVSHLSEWKFALGDDDVRRVRVVGPTAVRWEPLDRAECSANVVTDDDRRMQVSATHVVTGRIASVAAWTPMLGGDDYPIVAMYGPERGRKRDRDVAVSPLRSTKRTDGYQRWSDAGSTTEQLEQWMLGMALLEFQEGSQIPEFEVVKRAAANALPGCSEVGYRQHEGAVTVRFGEDQPPMELHMLSDGQRGLVTLMADLAIRMIQLNPHLRDKALEASGVVMIDELDVHLHPELQRHALTQLLATFPNVQFLVATHSPALLGETNDGQLFAVVAQAMNIDGHDNGGAHAVDGLRGMEIGWITRHTMDTPSRNPEVAEQIVAVRNLIDNQDYENARAQAIQLRAGMPEDPEITGILAMLTQLERAR